MTFEQFIRALEAEWSQLKKAGSRASAKFNSLRLNGVDGMPLTHQVGLGNMYRNGKLLGVKINLHDVNVRTHARMGAVAVGVPATAVSFKIHPVLGVLAGGLTGLGAYELYKDWQAGFKAAEFMPESYWRMFPPIRNSRNWVY